jgi:tripeptide aminopeptidase
MNIALLKEILATPTYSRLEFMMVGWLISYLTRCGYTYQVDPIGNIYVTKGVADVYPCLAAHTDSAHMPEEVTIVQMGDRLIALDQDSEQTGLGGDDKSGIFICLELLAKFDVVKVAFFVSEEIGCIGSKACVNSSLGQEFFSDVGYVMEFDSPCDTILTYSCDGVQLFPDEGPFTSIFWPILKEYGVVNWQHHPYTDVAVLKRAFTFPCLNLPAGYFRMHSKHEYVSLCAVSYAIEFGSKLLTALGLTRYHFLAKESKYSHSPLMEVTGLRTHG